MAAGAVLLAVAGAFALVIRVAPPSSPDPGPAIAGASLGVPTPAPLSAATTQQARDAYAKVAVGFAPNVGQTDARVRYVAEGAGFGFYFMDDRVVLSLTKAAGAEHGPRVSPAPGSLADPLDGAVPRRRGVVLELRFRGASAGAKLEADGRRAGVVNYLGGTARAARRSLPRFSALTYRGLWPGIDVRFHAVDGTLKYEFHVAPHADPDRIRLAYAGVRGLSEGPGGALTVNTRVGALRDARPVSYQRAGGARVPIGSRYVLGRRAGRGGSGYGFALRRYDHARPLVIDPGLDYSTFLGGAFGDFGRQIAVDDTGAVYVTGTTDSPDFPTTPGAFDPSHNGHADAFVTKLDPSGSALVYSTVLGGAASDEGRGIAVDPAGNAYVSGRTQSRDFPTTPGAFDTSPNGHADAFVAKLDATGSALVYSSLLGGSARDFAVGLAVDAAGNAYVSGTTSSAEFPTTSGAFDTTFNGLTDAFVTKLNASGSALVYSTLLGGARTDQDRALALGPGSDVYVAGLTASPDFPTTPSALDTSFNRDGGDAFVTRLNASGSALVFSTYLGGNLATAIAVDGVGDAYVIGSTSSATFPTTPGAFDTTLNGVADAFVTKLDAAGSAVYSTLLGGSAFDLGAAIAVDAAGDAHVSGFTSSQDFPITPDAIDGKNDGGDAFVTELDASGSALVFSTFLGSGETVVSVSDIALDATGGTYVTGSGDAGLPTTPGAFDPSYNGLIDAFVTKLQTQTAPASPDTLLLRPKAAVNRVDTQHCVTATVTAGGNAVPGIDVRFAVTGANPAGGTVRTDDHGEAVFCHTGGNPGDDAIRAFADTDRDGRQDPGEPGDAAAKTWILPPPQHYLCYDARPSGTDDDRGNGPASDRRPRGSGPLVNLRDQLGAGRARVERLRRLCNPVAKTHDGRLFKIEQPEAHLVSYRINRSGHGGVRHRVEVSDQFGTRIATVRRPHGLLVPSATAIPPARPGSIPTRLDHYACYPIASDDRTDARARASRPSVRLADEFASRRARVLRPLALCNPVEKRHAGRVFRIQQPDQHLTCYAIRTTGSTRRQVAVLDQFERSAVSVLTPRAVCVPARIVELPPPTRK